MSTPIMRSYASTNPRRTTRSVNLTPPGSRPIRKIYGWVLESFGTPDLNNAKTLLEILDA